jgi:hypothetical protein
VEKEGRKERDSAAATVQLVREIQLYAAGERLWTAGYWLLFVFDGSPSLASCIFARSSEATVLNV